MLLLCITWHTGYRFDAEDNLQEAFVKAFQCIGSFKGESTFGAWLKRIVVNQCISFLRKQKNLTVPITHDNAFEIHQTDDLEMDENMPIHEVMKAIEALPEGGRIVFTLKAIEAYKFREISEMLGITETNCKVQYHRSRKLLYQALKPLIYVD
jgi:RNA polymerase sigma-70 factor (ECF subfamily)